VVEKMSMTFPSATTPLLASVVIPCFNYGRFVREAVDSALSQTVCSLEVIVVDDGSTDPETHLVISQLEQLARVRVVRQDNLGLPSARNTGIAHARGEYVCCLDADDTLEPTYIEMAVAVMETDRSVGFAYSWVQLFQDETRVWHTRDFDFEGACADNHTSAAAVFRRDDWMAADCFRPDMRKGYEDWEFWLRLSALGRRGRVLRTPLFNHRRHGRTMTHDAHAKRQHIISMMRELNPSIFNTKRVHRQIESLSAIEIPCDPLRTLRLPGVLAASDPRPHLIVIAPWLGDGGAEILLLDILAELKDHWRITIVTTCLDQQPWWSKFAAITTDIVPLFGAFTEEARHSLLDHLIATRGTRVVLSHGSTFAYDCFAGLKQRHPFLAVIDILHNDLPSGHIRSAVVASENIDIHVAISDRIARSLFDYGVLPERIVTIPNGVDTVDVFRPDRYERIAARRALGLSETGAVLAWIGRLAEEKRPQQFLDIVASFDAHKPLTGLIVGDGPLTASVNRSINRARKNKIDIRHFAHMPREEIARVYVAADFLVITSSIEGLPFVALEALACGCPVAATDVGDLRLLIRDGETGFLVPADKTDELTKLISSTLDDASLLARMRMAARKQVSESEFTRTKMTGDYRSLISGMHARSEKIEEARRNA
jgi:glycosyltransferase involved in cell wall biosynthesis